MNKPTPSDRRSAMAAALGSFALLATGCGERGLFHAAPVHTGQALRGLAMGSSYTVKVAAPGLSAAAVQAAHQAVAAALADVVARMSHYEAGSELARLNRHPVGEAFALSAPTLAVFEVAQRVRQASGGAFDVAVGRAVDAWGFGPTQRPQRVPPPEELASLRAGPGALLLDTKAHTLTRQAPVWANLSGIAKGYGVDRAALALEALGLGDYMVEVGGEIRTRGHNAQGQPWQLAIEKPDALPQQALTIVPLSGRALATSGDYRNFFMHEGRRYSHEIDPARAEPVQHRLASVSVVAADCTQADAWSTALFVLGPERGMALAEQQGLAAHFVLRQGDGYFSERSTAAFVALGPRAA